MSDPAPPQPVDYVSPATSAADQFGEASPLLRLAGLIGLVACLSGFAVLLAGCAGLRWFALAPYIVVAGAAGLLLALLAAAVQRRRITEETHLLLALFANVISIIGGLLEMAVLKGWPLFPK
jgi:hypothetical protein